jgi:hypothetical protein
MQHHRVHLHRLEICITIDYYELYYIPLQILQVVLHLNDLILMILLMTEKFTKNVITAVLYVQK